MYSQSGTTACAFVQSYWSNVVLYHSKVNALPFRMILRAPNKSPIVLRHTALVHDGCLVVALQTVQLSRVYYLRVSQTSDYFSLETMDSEEGGKPYRVDNDLKFLNLNLIYQSEILPPW